MSDMAVLTEETPACCEWRFQAGVQSPSWRRRVGRDEEWA